jgi:cytochrome P450
MVSKAFTARHVEGMRDHIHEQGSGLIEEMVTKGTPIDFVDAYAAPLPMTVISELLGVPLADREQFRSWAEAVLSSNAHSQEWVQQAVVEVAQYVAGLIRAKRQEPGGDLLSRLIAVHDEDDGRLSNRELHALANVLLIAGYDPTLVALIRALWILLGERRRYAALVKDPSLIPATVEEVLRHQAGDGDLMRVAKEDIDIGPVRVRQGEVVVASLTGANRDPRHFTGPDRFDINRAENSHISFGHGRHFCLGAALSRLEVQVTLELLVEKLPELRLAVPPNEIVWTEGLITRRPKTMPVEW